MICKNFGIELDDTVTSCSNCGTPIDQTENVNAVAKESSVKEDNAVMLEVKPTFVGKYHGYIATLEMDYS